MTPHVSISLLLTQSDERLVRMTAAGHDRAFEAIVDRYRRPLLRYAERFPAAGPAEDVVQAAFVRAWGALRDGTEVRDLRPWLYRIVHNTALNAVKRQGSDDAELIESEDPAVGPECEIEIQEDLRRTLGGIAALPGRQRSALLAVAVDGRRHADVGRELGITEPAVRQLVRRARATVRAAASVLTPYPLMAWIAQAGGEGAGVVRIGEIVGGAGTGALVLKLGTVAATTGALVVGAPHAQHMVQHHHRTVRATAQVAVAPALQLAKTSAGQTRTIAVHAAATQPRAARGHAGSPSAGTATGLRRSVTVAPAGAKHRWAPASSPAKRQSAPAAAKPIPGRSGQPPTGPTGTVETISAPQQAKRHQHARDAETDPASEHSHGNVRTQTTETHADEPNHESGSGTSSSDRESGDQTTQSLKDNAEKPEGPEAPESHGASAGATGSAGSPAP